MDAQDLASLQSATSQLMFTCFPRLPSEIQILIWNWTLEQRVLEIVFNHGADDVDSGTEHTDYEKGSVYLHNEVGFHTATKPPVAMEVCQSSRLAVISSYPLCFGSSWYPRRIRCNFKLDVIFLNNMFWKVVPLFFSLLDNYEIDNFRLLAIDLGDFGSDYINEHCPVIDDAGFEKRLMTSIESLKRLKELLLVDMVDAMQPYNGEWKYISVDIDGLVLFDELPKIFLDGMGGETDHLLGIPSSGWVKEVKVKNKRCVIGWRKSVQFVPNPGDSRAIDNEEC